MAASEQWTKKKVLITVRTYPIPSKKDIEVSCTAGISDGQWIRLFPIPYRFLDGDKRFRKYQYIEADVIKSHSDPRPESYKVNIDSIKILTEPITTKDNWLARKDLIIPFSSKSLCFLKEEHSQKDGPTLGLFKPGKITGLKIKKARSEWTKAELERLQQDTMFGNGPKVPLEKLPFDFFYEFQCNEPGCTSHTLSCTDWEMGISYLNWKKQYGRNWENKFRETYETKMILDSDTYFYVGTVHGHPSEWIIIGLFYPPKNTDNAFQANLLDRDL
jgi:hypothetical protein